MYTAEILGIMKIDECLRYPALNCLGSLAERAVCLKVYLVWMPGRGNIPVNCNADDVARLGTTSEILGDLRSVAMSCSSCKRLV